MSLWRSLAREGRRVAVTVVGFAVLLAGVFFLFVPGPGLPLIIGGLAILASEYVWARRALDKTKAKATAMRRRMRRKKNR